MVSRDSKIDNVAISLSLFIYLFFCCWLLLGLVIWPRLDDPSVCQSPIGVYACYFLRQVLAFAYTICSDGQIWIYCTSQCITLPTQSRLVLYSFCDNLLHSLIIWLMISSLSPHSLHLLFCCVLYILTSISSSSSYRAGSTDIPDPLSPLLPIVHHPR